MTCNITNSNNYDAGLHLCLFIHRFIHCNYNSVCHLKEIQYIYLSIIIGKEVVGEVVGNCFRAQNHLQWQITNRQKLLALASLDEGFN